MKKTRVLLALCTLVFFTGCSSVPLRREGASWKAWSAGRKVEGGGEAVVETARSQIGRPYRYGGTSPKRGFDCSGLVDWTYGRFGLRLPHSSRRLFRLGNAVSGGGLKQGDLVFFVISGRSISHVGIYSGYGNFIHAPKRGERVMESSLKDRYWKRRYRGARRLLG